MSMRKRCPEIHMRPVRASFPPTTPTPPSGDVTGDLVYVNYGVPADYESLDKLGIDVKGKIVIARYGGSWRGIKPKVAAEHGAVGCIIYSDPRDDGYFNGETLSAWPIPGRGHGAARERHGHAAVSGRPHDPRAPVQAGRRASLDGTGDDVRARSRCCRSRIAQARNC